MELIFNGDMLEVIIFFFGTIVLCFLFGVAIEAILIQIGKIFMNFNRKRGRR